MSRTPRKRFWRKLEDLSHDEDRPVLRRIAGVLRETGREFLAELERGRPEPAPERDETSSRPPRVVVQ